jgi:hypothetical protein
MREPAFLAYVRFVERRLAPVAISAIGIYYTFVQTQSLDKDTTLITNAAFVISITLASVTFGYTRALESSVAIRNEVVEAGERFFQAAIFFISGTILKYPAVAVYSNPRSDGLKVIAGILAGASVIMFIRAVIFVAMAVNQITAILWQRRRNTFWGLWKDEEDATKGRDA